MGGKALTASLEGMVHVCAAVAGPEWGAATMSSLEGMVRARMGGTTPWQGLRAATMHPWRGWTSRPERGERHHGGVVSRPPCEMQLKRVASGAACGDVVFSAAAPPCVRLLAWARGSLRTRGPPGRAGATLLGGRVVLMKSGCRCASWGGGRSWRGRPACRLRPRLNSEETDPWCGIHVGR